MRLSVEQLGETSALVWVAVGRLCFLMSNGNRVNVEEVVQANAENGSHCARDLEIGTLDRFGGCQPVECLRIDREPELSLDPSLQLRHCQIVRAEQLAQSRIDRYAQDCYLTIRLDGIVHRLEGYQIVSAILTRRAHVSKV